MKYKVGDILRNPYCPGDGSPSRVCVYLGQESYCGNKHVVMYQDGSMGRYSPKEFGKHPPYELIGDAIICTDSLLAVVQTLCKETDRETWEEYLIKSRRQLMTPKNSCAKCKWYRHVTWVQNYGECTSMCTRPIVSGRNPACNEWEAKDEQD